MKKSFVLTTVIGSILVMIIIIGTTLWASKRTSIATAEAISAVNSLYLEEMADHSSKTFANLINNNFEQMEKALYILRVEEISSQEELRTRIGTIQTLLSLDRFALVDEDNIVYTQYTTYTGGSRHEFLSDDKLNSRVVRTVFLYGSSKQLCLAIPADGLTLLGKPFKACFVQIDIEDIVELLGLNDSSGTSFGLYYENGENLSNTALGATVSKKNILSEMKKVLPEDEWNEFKAHFTDKTGGCLTFDADGTEEMLCYVPISDTKWVLVMLVRESMIDEQIRGISECNLSTDRQQIAATLISVLLLATVLLLLMKKNSTEKLEAEKKNSRAFRNMANTDALTGVKNKYAYSEYEAALDRRIQEKELVDVGVAVCDINNLKQVNDAQGHLAGDQLIKEACAMICSSFAHSPVFRIGGDEFVVLLEKADFYAKDDILNKLNQQIEDNLKKGGVVIAIGVSVLMPGDKYLHVVFERADLMMYERKKELKGRK